MGDRRFERLSLIDARPGDTLLARAGCVAVALPHDAGVPHAVESGTPMVLLGVATVRVMLPGRRVVEVRADAVCCTPARWQSVNSASSSGVRNISIQLIA